MKVILRGYGVGMNLQQRFAARGQAADTVRTRGTGKKPGSPRDVFVQSGPRGVLVNWRGPDGFAGDIAGWRIYKDTELALFAEVKDPNTTQHFIETSSGSTPPATNIFVSSVNNLGIESPLVQAQGTAILEAGAPTMPVTPPSYQSNVGKGRFCPHHGAPVKLYGDPDWWQVSIHPCTEFFRVVTTHREGVFSRGHRMFSDRGLLPLRQWIVGDLALTEDGEEVVTRIDALDIADGKVDRYEAKQGHIYSAWGFIGHNLKPSEG